MRVRPNEHVVHFNNKVSSPQDLYIILLAAAAQAITTNNSQCPNSSTPANQLPIIVLSSAMMAVPFFSKQQNSKLKCGWGLEFFVFFIFVRILWWQLADTTVKGSQLLVSCINMAVAAVLFFVQVLSQFFAKLFDERKIYSHTDCASFQNDQIRNSILVELFKTTDE